MKRNFITLVVLLLAINLLGCRLHEGASIDFNSRISTWRFECDLTNDSHLTATIVFDNVDKTYTYESSQKYSEKLITRYSDKGTFSGDVNKIGSKVSFKLNNYTSYAKIKSTKYITMSYIPSKDKSNEVSGLKDPQKKIFTRTKNKENTTPSDSIPTVSTWVFSSECDLVDMYNLAFDITFDNVNKTYTYNSSCNSTKRTLTGSFSGDIKAGERVSFMLNGKMTYADIKTSNILSMSYIPYCPSNGYYDEFPYPSDEIFRRTKTEGNTTPSDPNPIPTVSTWEFSCVLSDNKRLNVSITFDNEQKNYSYESIYYANDYDYNGYHCKDSGPFYGDIKVLERVDFTLKEKSSYADIRDSDQLSISYIPVNIGNNYTYLSSPLDQIFTRKY